MEDTSRKLLIVERKLISNRGHHHTQIGALKSLFPGATTHVLAGDGYDGFLGEAVGKIASESLKSSRLRAKMKFGSFPERFAARIRATFNGHLYLPTTAYGQKLIEICDLQGYTDKDIVIIPSADIDSLESAIDLAVRRGDAAPLIALRFLSPTMGEKSERLLRSRLRHCNEQLTAKVKLFTETEELAAYFRDQYALSVGAGFLLPCSLGFLGLGTGGGRSDGVCRVGVFGAPRQEKGSERIASIAHAVAERLEQSAVKTVEFIVQGSTDDFSEQGFYRNLKGFMNFKGVSVSIVSDRLSPAEFVMLFKSVDVVLLPYDVDVYRLQGSGVIQDAVVALKPMILTRGMAMSELTRHGNSIHAVTDEEFAEAILAINEDSHYEGAVRAYSAYKYQLFSFISNFL